MSQAILEQNQREDLLVLLGRRLRKLEDKALLELERLTRNLQQLTGFVSTAKRTVVGKMSPSLPSIAANYGSQAPGGYR